ncbi:hypothetical protein HK104_000433, partial [Borealophlyctis nickersoniae]
MTPTPGDYYSGPERQDSLRRSHSTGSSISSPEPEPRKSMESRVISFGHKLFGKDKEKDKDKEKEGPSVRYLQGADLERVFEIMLNDLKAQGPAREKMLSLDTQKKQLMVHGWQQQKRQALAVPISPPPTFIASTDSLHQPSTMPPPRTVTLISRQPSVHSNDGSSEKLHQALIRVLDKLEITGAAREGMLRLDDKRKQEVIQSYLRSQEISRQKAAEAKASASSQPAILQRSPTLRPPDQLSREEFEHTFSLVLDRLDIRGAARDNMMRLGIPQKREIIYQYQRLKAQEDSHGGIHRIQRSGSTSSQSDVSRTPSTSSTLSEGSRLKVSERNDSLMSGTSVVNMTEQSPHRFVALLGNRNTPLKALFRHLTAFRITLSLAGPNFIKDFTEADVPYLGPHGVHGMRALEIALDRVTELKNFQGSRPAPPSSQRPPRASGNYPRQPQPPASGFSNTSYADAVLGDELRLEAVRCVRLIMNVEAGCAAAMACPGLVKQLVYCLATPEAGSQQVGSDSRVRHATLTLKIAAADVLGPMCLLSDRGHALILQSFTDLSIAQSEPARFHYIVASLLDPFVGPDSSRVSAPARYAQSQVSEAETEANEEDDEDDEEKLLWDYRTAILVLINGLVSSLEEARERWRIRRELEDRGLRRILQALLDMDPPEPLLIQIDAYEDDREDDLEEMEATFREKNAEMSDPQETLAQILEYAHSLPDRERAHHTIASTLVSIFSVVESLKKRVDALSDSQSQPETEFTPGQSDGDLEVREDIADALSLMEQASTIIGRRVSGWSDSAGAGADAVPGAKDGPGPGPTGRKNKYAGLVAELVQGIEDVAGVPLGVQVEGAGGSGGAGDGPGSGGLLGVVRELDNIKQLYADALAAAERQRKEIEFLKASLARYQGVPPALPPRDAGPSPPPPTSPRPSGGSSGVGRLWDEIRRLEAIVTDLRRTQREELSRPGRMSDIREEELVRVEQALAHLKGEEYKKPAVVAPPPVPAVAKPPPPPPPGPGAAPPPPPPGMGGPPPPPGAGMKSNLKIVKANRAMKPLVWTKIPNHAATSTLWEGVAVESYSSDAPKPVLNESELAELFSKEESPSTSRMSTPAQPRKVEKKVIQLIERKRAQNMGIMLGGIRLSYPAIRNAILSFDGNVLSVERLQMLRQWAPTEEECDIVRAYEGDFEELGSAERYIREVMDVPRLAHRLDCMLFWKTFDEEMEEVIPDLDTVLSAIDQVRTSKRLRTVLKNVLLLGNYLNGTSFRGDAYGFKVEALVALKDTKAASGNRYMVPTLLHYLAKKLQENEPDSLRFMAELPGVELAARVCIPALFQSIRQLRAGVEAVKEELAEVQKLGTPSQRDRFIDVMEGFRLSADVRVKSAEEKAAIAEKNLAALMQFFGEDPKDRSSAPEEFFGVFVTFDKFLQKARKDNEVAERKLQQLREQQEREQAARAAQIAANLSPPGDNLAPGNLNELRNSLMAVGGTPSEDGEPAIPKFLGGGMARLKPVAGALPFSKRLTIRGAMPRIRVDDGE